MGERRERRERRRIERKARRALERSLRASQSSDALIDDCPICAALRAMTQSGLVERMPLPPELEALGLEVHVSTMGAARSSARS